MDKIKLYIFAAYLIWNFIVFIVYGVDKYKAKHDKWRVPEKTLILLAFLMGGVGALLGMKVFHHKTKHKLFTIGVPVCIICNIAMVLLPVYFKWHLKLKILRSL